jgi:hypothetical protein
MRSAAAERREDFIPPQTIDPFANAVMAWYSESVRSALGHYAQGWGWASSLLAYALHTVRTSNLDHRLTRELFMKIAEAGKQLAKDRNACAHIVAVITTIETAEHQGRVTREEAASILDWMYHARDVAAW